MGNNDAQSNCIAGFYPARKNKTLRCKQEITDIHLNIRNFLFYSL